MDICQLYTSNSYAKIMLWSFVMPV